jgi:6-pyruvoyl-tetrahydropterin synthase
MIAHSLPEPYFGPASGLHGATYIVDAEFFSEKLNTYNVVLDIGYAQEMLKEVLKSLNYKNLDVETDFRNHLTTTEFLAKHIHGQLISRVKDNFQGKIRVTLGESHVAWASYESEK